VTRSAFAAVVAASLLFAAPAAAFDGEATVTHEQPAAKLSGPVATGLNVSFFVHSLTGTGGCGTDVVNRCATFLFKADEFVGTQGLGAVKTATATFRLDGYTAASDFDLRVYESNEQGQPGTYLGSPTSTDVGDSSPLGGDDPRYTGAGDFENKVVPGVRPGRYYLVMVPYFSVVEDKPDVTMTLSKTAPVPPAEG
jgi:hypothetical protein